MMTEIKLLNKIGKAGIDRFDGAKYTLSEDAASPAGILVRSAAMHEMTFGPELLAIARAGAGTNNIPIDECTRRGIVVFNTPGANANAVAELVICGLMLGSRNVAGGIDWARTLDGQGAEVAKLVEKGKAQFAGPEVRGKTLGVIGLGAIGAIVANAAAQGLGMNVIGYDPFISVESAWSLSRAIKRSSSVDEIYRTADYITVHVPLTDATRGMLGESAIAQMKDGVYLLNTSRGMLVESEALLDALKSGKIAGAGLDVYEEETDFFFEDRSDMVKRDTLLSLLVSMPNVVLTSHQAFLTKEALHNIAQVTLENLDAYFKDGTVLNPVQ